MKILGGGGGVTKVINVFEFLDELDCLEAKRILIVIIDKGKVIFHQKIFLVIHAFPKHRGHRGKLLPELPRHVRDLHQGGGRGAPGLQCGGVRVSRIYLGPERNHPLQTAGHAHCHRGQQDRGPEGEDRVVPERDGGHRLSGLGGRLHRMQRPARPEHTGGLQTGSRPGRGRAQDRLVVGPQLH